MAKRDKKPPEHYNFESRSKLKQNKSGKWQHRFINPKNQNEETDSAAQIMYSMLISDAFQDLTARQRMLYVYSKAQFYGARSRPCDDFKEIPEFQEWQGRKYFYLNRKLMSDIYGLYEKGSRKLYADIDALIGHGFIERYSQGGNVKQDDGYHGNHMRSIYFYSDKWKDWKS